MQKCRLPELKQILQKTDNTFVRSVQKIKNNHIYSRLEAFTAVRYGIRPAQYISVLFTGVLVIMTISYIFYESVIASVFLSPFLIFYIKEKSCEIKAKQKRQLTNQFKDAIVAVSFSLNVGYSIENAFRQAANEMVILYGADSMIVKEFKNISRRIECNENLETLLEEFAKKSNVSDIAYFSSVFRYAKRCGGNLIAIIKSTAEKISQKTEVNNEVQTMISGKKMEQRVMSIIPFVIILYLKFTAADFIQPLYGNAAGAAIMTVCLIIYTVSYYLSKRIVNIEI